MSLIYQAPNQCASCRARVCTQSCLIHCNLMDCNLSGSSAHGTFQARNTGVGCPFLFSGIFPTQGSNLVSCVFCTGRWIFYHWATWEGKCSGNKLIMENRQWRAMQQSRTYIWVGLNVLFHENVDIKHSFMATAYSGWTEWEYI